MKDTAALRALIDAAATDPEQARVLLAEAPELLGQRYIHGETALHFLAVEGHAAGVRFLAEAGTDVNACNTFGDAPLIDVATLGNAEIAAILLQYGADPGAPSTTRDNPVHTAVISGHAEVLEVILAAGGKTDYVTELGETVWDAIAQAPGDRERMERLLEQHGAHRTTTG